MNKEIKQELKESFQIVDFIGSRAFIRILIVVVVVGIISSISGVYYKKWKVDKDREIFKESIVYNETVSSFLADCYQQYNKAESVADKTAIMEYVIMRYPNLDISAIENIKLQQFYNKCLMGGN